ncbi:MAG: glycosyltransferase family 2 protein [Oscillospiraceae bacterium]|nr:glycosyltransferase family 2 protein [Oscillospiraceae bacterium]
MNTDILYLVSPCYNEQEVIPETSKLLKAKLESLIERQLVSPQSRILLVDDGSKDNTWNLIAELYGSCELFEGLKLSRNRGQQNALLAGLTYAKERCDIAISLDVDLQDDINAIDGFIEKYHQGCDIVYGVRSSRATDTFFKRNTALAFYKFMSILGVDIVGNHAEYRLMTKRALDGLFEFDEVNLFLRGIIPQIGYKSDIVLYERHERAAGVSKYPLKKMLALAFEAITSFSVKPIKMITAAGIFFSISSAIALIVLLIVSFSSSVAPLLTIACFIALALGIQLLATGIVGEYVGKVYMETKKRPRFIIEQYLSRK